MKKKTDEPIDLKQKATPFTRVQIESLQNAVQVTGKNKEQDSKDSKQLVKQKRSVNFNIRRSFEKNGRKC